MKRFPVIIAICCIAGHLCAQDGKWEAEYQRIKDSLALLYPNIPTVSSILIKEKQVEVNVYVALLTANRFRDDNGDLADYSFRETYMFKTLQVNYGVSRNERLNIGLAVQTTTGRIDENREASPLKIFSSNTDAFSHYENGITAITPRIRWRPIARNYKFTIHSSISLPTADKEKQSILGRRQVFWLNQFIYNQPLSDRFFLLTQLSTQYGFERSNTPWTLSTPLSGYLSYFIPRNTVLFALINYVPVFYDNGNRQTLQAGVGGQYQISRRFLINGYYSNDLIGKNYPDFSTYTIGARYVTR